jgi:5-methylcytosine-specific restriction endonuclease McrA
VAVRGAGRGQGLSDPPSFSSSEDRARWQVFALPDEGVKTSPVACPGPRRRQTPVFCGRPVPHSTGGAPRKYCPEHSPRRNAGFSTSGVRVHCSRCGASFAPRWPHQTHCSHVCSRTPWADRPAATRAPRVRGTGTCPGCLKAFEIRKHLQVHCSPACVRVSRERARIERRVGMSCVVPWSSCRACGVPIVARFGAKVCRDCRGTSRAVLGYVGPTRLECSVCGVAWIVEGRGTRQRPRCPGCQEEHKRRMRRGSGAEIRRRRTAARIRRLRPRLLERYGGRCGICNRPIDLALHWMHPQSLTIDHIHPISAGGSDDESNLWPAHRQCNEEKGDEIGWDPASPLRQEAVA